MVRTLKLDGKYTDIPTMIPEVHTHSFTSVVYGTEYNITYETRSLVANPDAFLPIGEEDD